MTGDARAVRASALTHACGSHINFFIIIGHVINKLPISMLERKSSDATVFMLHPQVFLCLANDYLIALDLAANRYLALESARTRGLASLVPGWPVPNSNDGHVAQESSHAIAQQLERRGILCRSPHSGKSAAPVAYSIATQELLGSDGPNCEPLRFGTTLTLLGSALRVKVRMRLVALSRVITRMQARRARLATTDIDLAQLRELVHAFNRLRPLLFSSRDACLFNSLVLWEFLAAHGIFADCVFGVCAAPFRAHCWLQHEGIVVNDSLEHVRGLTPIMVV